MGLIPEEVKQVQRPKSTSVRSFGHQYYVYPYTSVWDSKEKRIKKKTLPYIGKIVLDEETNSWVYIERDIEPPKDESEVKIYGDVSFVDSLNKDLHKELVSYYGEKDGTKIYVFSILRLIYGDTNSFLDDAYYHSFLSELYPNIAVSKNSILEFIKALGMKENTNKKFLISRVKRKHKILIFDGFQITNESKTNANTEFGRSAKKTNKTQICEIKVYDTISKEPIYYDTIPGNVVDKTAFIQVLNNFDVKNAIIIIDKGFNTKENIEYMQENNIKYILPFNDNAKIISKILNENDYQEVFKWNDKTVKGLKVIDDGNIYYLYQDPYIRARQESNYINKISEGKQGYDMEGLRKKQNKFGVICFSSNLDTSILDVYSIYKERWEIEVNIRLEKTSLDNEVIRLHGTLGSLGVRYLVHIEMIMLSRIYFKLKELNLLEKYSIRTILNLLSRTYKINKNGIWKTSIMTKKKQVLLDTLGVQV